MIRGSWSLAKIPSYANMQIGLLGQLYEENDLTNVGENQNEAAGYQSSQTNKETSIRMGSGIQSYYVSSSGTTTSAATSSQIVLHSSP